MSPQIENGYTPIANELFEAFYRCKLLEYERVIVMCIWRKTYGWSKASDWISNTQIEEETGIALPNITRTLNSLKVKKLVIKNGNRMSINKRYKEWEVEWRKVISPDNKVISPDNQKLSHEIPTKTKNNYTKTISDKSQKNMSWNKQSEEEELVIDAETGELTNPIQEKKKESKEVTARKRELVDWLIKYQGRDPVRTSIPKQLKALNRIIEMRVTGAEAQQIIMEQMGNEFWRGKKEKPDFCTVVAIIEKRGE
jgi:phage replication O-like protein O